MSPVMPYAEVSDAERALADALVFNRHPDAQKAGLRQPRSVGNAR